MKKIILAISILISITSFSQDITYNDNIKFNLTDSVEDGITMKRKAIFEALIYNQRTKEISMQFNVRFFGNTGIEVKMVRNYSKELIVRNTEYVVSATGVYVGTINNVLALYGVKVNNEYTKHPDGRYILTTPCMGFYDWFVKTNFELNNKLQNVIRNYGIAEAAKGKLN